MGRSDTLYEYLITSTDTNVYSIANFPSHVLYASQRERNRMEAELKRRERSLGFLRCFPVILCLEHPSLPCFGRLFDACMVLILSFYQLPIRHEKSSIPVVALLNLAAPQVDILENLTRGFDVCMFGANEAGQRQLVYPARRRKEKVRQLGPFFK